MEERVYEKGKCLSPLGEVNGGRVMVRGERKKGEVIRER